MEKQCTKCNKNLDISNFSPKSGRVNQYMSYCKDCFKIYRCTRYQKNKEHERIICNQWYQKNKDKKYAYEKVFRKQHYAQNPVFRLAINIRVRLNNILRKEVGYIKRKNIAVDNLGCSVEELKAYLESKFTVGMDWNNRSKWHIDHIIPLSSFDLSDPNQLKKACHYTNLQPLWAKDNLKKGSKHV